MSKITAIDFRNSTIGDVLKQIKKSNFKGTSCENSPPLCSARICSIQPRQTRDLIKFIDAYIPKAEQEKFHHLKRFRKIASEDGIYIEALLCRDTFIDADILKSWLEEDSALASASKTLRAIRVPCEAPLTKEIAQDWSTRIWPMAWKGNPDHQALITSTINTSMEANIVELLAQFHKSNSRSPFATIIGRENVTNGKFEVLCYALDERNKHPLKHSIMNAISQIAHTEIEQRKANGDSVGYLCHNLLVYTTHEPCAMCAMALVHSRIGRLTYLFAHDRGAIESSLFIGDRKDLNWSYDIWRWVGNVDLEDSEEARSLDP